MTTSLDRTSLDRPSPGRTWLDRLLLLRTWFAPAPAERLAMLRVLVGGYALVYLIVRATHLLSYAGLDPMLFQPVGVVSILPRPLLPVVVQALVAASVALAVPFFLGWRYRVTAPLFAVCLLWVLTYSNSWGKILHTDNVLVLHVAVLSVVPASEALSIDARGRAAPASGRYGWPIHLMCLLGVAVYVLAGVAKLRNSGFDFIGGDTLRNYVAFDNVRKIELGSMYSPLGAAMLPHATAFVVMAWLSFVLELGAPLALLHRRVGRLWAVMVWGFHVGVLALMAIGFAYQLSAIAFACFFPVERLLELPLVRRFVRPADGKSTR
jgi:hypothetical protein